MDKKEVIDFFKDLIFIIIVVVLVKSFLVMPFQISGQSMYSSYYDKEFIIVDRLSYIIWDSERWDVVVFKPYVDDDKKYFLKRIIGIPWDTVKIEDGKVYLKKQWEKDYKELDEKYLNSENKWFTFVGWSREKHEYVVWEWQYFVMWDNRNHSTDSRECFSSCAIEWRDNYAKWENITGRVLVDLWYFDFRSFSFMQPNLWIDTKPRFLNSPNSYSY